MPKRFLFLTISGAISCLITQNGLAVIRYNSVDLGSAQCPDVDQISHTPSMSWKVRDAGWIIYSQDKNNALTGFSRDTQLRRSVYPYHIGYALADIYCGYNTGLGGKDTLVLKRTYQEENGLYPEANLIVADNNLLDMQSTNTRTYNRYSSCDTVLSNLSKCDWHFYSSNAYNDHLDVDTI